MVNSTTDRRTFIRAVVVTLSGAFLLVAGAADKIFRFFFGPRLSRQDESKLMKARLQRLKEAETQRALDLERQESDYILVAALSQLSPSEGKYFIDYEMRPALAFLGSDGLPNLLSAKCTHLGCTVGNIAEEGKILCPCHISYFDIKSGQPNLGSPAKLPLPHVAWVLKNRSGEIVAMRTSDGETHGTTSGAALNDCDVYISKSEVQSLS
jgi:Rieske Fe-S protein